MIFSSVIGTAHSWTLRFTQHIENCVFCGKCVFDDTQIAVSAFVHCALRIAYLVNDTQIAVSAFAHCVLRIAYRADLVNDTQIAVSVFAHCVLRIAYPADCRECVCTLRIAYCVSSRLP